MGEGGVLEASLKQMAALKYLTLLISTRWGPGGKSQEPLDLITMISSPSITECVPNVQIDRVAEHKLNNLISDSCCQVHGQNQIQSQQTHIMTKSPMLMGL